MMLAVSSVTLPRSPAVLSSFPIPVGFIAQPNVVPATDPAAPPPPPPNTAVMFVVDESLPKADLVAVTDAVETALSGVGAASVAGLTTFGTAVRVYETGVRAVASADVFSGRALPAAATHTAIQNHERMPPTAGGEYVTPTHVSAPSIVSTLKALPGYSPRRSSDRALGPGLAVGLSVLTAALDADGSRDRLAGAGSGSGSGSGGPPAASTSHLRGRIIVVTSGPPSLGPGALGLGHDAASKAAAKSLHGSSPDTASSGAEPRRVFAQLGAQALNAGVAVDVLCLGHGGFGVRVLQAATGVTGGSVLLHSSVDDGLRTNLETLVRQRLADVVLSVVVDEPLYLRQLIGPVCRLEDVAASSRAGGGGGDSDSKTAAGLTFSSSEPLPSQWSYNLLVPRLDTSTGVCVLLGLTDRVHERVKTAKLRVTATVRGAVGEGVLATREEQVEMVWESKLSDQIAGVDDSVAAVLLAKLAVLDAVNHGVDSGRELVETQCRDVARLAGSLLGDRGAEMVFEAMTEHLYYTRRGPLLGPLLQHPDDMAAVAGLFLRADVGGAIRLMHPSLQMHTPRAVPSADAAGAGAGAGKDDAPATGGRHRPPFLLSIPVTTLAMQSNVMLLLDNQTHLFLWCGAAVAGPEYQSVRDELEAMLVRAGAGRFPQPVVMCVTEGQSMARWVACRLQPGHHDPPMQQLVEFPGLRGLDPPALTALRQKLLRSDEDSLFQFKSGLLFAPNPR